MILIALLLAAQTAPVTAPSAAAEALGVRLARAGTLATIAPLLTAKDIDELVASHAELDAADKDRLRATAKRVADAYSERLNTALGQAYAKQLSIDDLRALVAFNEGGASRRFRAALPPALMSAMGSVGQIDFKGDAIAAFCRETGKACPTAKK